MAAVATVTANAGSHSRSRLEESSKKERRLQTPPSRLEAAQQRLTLLGRSVSEIPPPTVAPARQRSGGSVLCPFDGDPDAVPRRREHVHESVDAEQQDLATHEIADARLCDPDLRPSDREQPGALRPDRRQVAAHCTAPGERQVSVGR